MQKLLCLLLVCLVVLSGCAYAPEPELSDMLGKLEGSLSLCSLKSEEALQDLLSRVTSTK